MNSCYAIIPAAGSSRRMGTPKLLLPWPVRREPSSGSELGTTTTSTVIDSVLQAWTTSRVDETIVVIRSDDTALIDLCRRWPVTIVHPTEATKDMKGSICVGLQCLISRHAPTPATRCFIAPADLPGLTSGVIDRMMDAPVDNGTVLIPRFGETLDASTDGHPVLLPWNVTSEIFALPPHEGVDTLIKRHPLQYILFPRCLAVTDIDTPSEYQTALRSLKSLDPPDNPQV